LHLHSGVLALHCGSIWVAQRLEHCLSGDGAGTSVIARLFGKDDWVRLATV
jgi:hypothetical protein